MLNSIVEKWRNTKTEDKILELDLKNPVEKLKKHFDKKMVFGTAGIRGIMGAGTSKINEFTISAAAAAYAKFILKNNKSVYKKGVVIGHDNRNNSRFFSEITAKVLEEYGIKSFLFENNDMQPTPVVSYTIRKLKLAGGVIITASHNPKEYNGFKVYNKLGAQLLENETKEIQTFMKSIDPLIVKKSNNKLNFLDSSIISSYIDDTIKGTKLFNDFNSSVKVAFSPLHGTSTKIVPKILSKIGVQNWTVKKQAIFSTNFKYTKSSNPEDSAAYNKVISLARRKKADIALVTDPDADRLGVVVKYKKRYKYLNGNQLAALYLDYKLSVLKRSNKLPKNGYIVKSNVSGNLVNKIASKFKIKIHETNVGFKNIANLIQNKKGTFLLGFEESYGMVINSDLVRDKDSIQSIVGVVEMVDYYKKQNINLFSHLNDLYSHYGIHRTVQVSKKLNSSLTNKLMKKIKSKKSIADHKIDYIDDYRKQGTNGLDKTNLIKVFFKNGSWLAIRPSGTEPKVKIYVQAIGNKKEKLMDVVIFEKEIFNFINDETETFENKSWSWKSFFKYLIFILIIVGIMSLVFLKVYNQGTSGKNVFTISRSIFKLSNTFSWVGIVLSMILMSWLSAWIRKRLLNFQGQKVKFKYLLLSGYMGQIISFITPFTIGGDAIGYWYLRRKGVKRAPLLSSFIVSTIIWQIGTVLQTVIFLPVGFPVYRMIFSHNDPQTHAALIMFIVNASWDVFATFMIISLTLSKKFQEGIVRIAIRFLEWIPFIHVNDPGKKASSYQYEFMEMRKGVKKIFNHKWIFFEALTYEMLPKIFWLYAFWNINLGIVRDDLPLGKYWTQIIAGDLISTANSMSITPGGSGTGEWLNITINQLLYKPISDQSSNMTASALDFTWKIILQWPTLIFSSLLIPYMIIGENRNKKYSKSKQNTTYFKKTIWFWIAPITIWFLIIFLF